MRRQIVITGAGLVTSSGEDPDELARRVTAGTAGDFDPVQIDGVPTDAGWRAGSVRDADPEEFLRDRKSLKYMDALSRLAVRAAGLARRDAGLEGRPVLADRVGVYMGIGYVASELKDLRAILVSGRTPEGRYDPSRIGQGCRLNPISVFRSLPNIPACNVSIGLGFRGDNSVQYPGSPQTAIALEEAVEALREERCDLAFAGGAAHVTNFLSIHTMRMLGYLPPGNERRSAPPADGAAVLVMERISSARARGARIQGEVLEIVTSSGEGAPYRGLPGPDGLRRAIGTAVAGRSGEGGILIPGDDGTVMSRCLLKEAARDALGRHHDLWTRFDTRLLTGNMTAANLPADLMIALRLCRDRPESLCLVGATGTGSDVGVCLVRSWAS